MSTTGQDGSGIFNLYSKVLFTYFSTLGYFRNPVTHTSGYLVINVIITTSETHNRLFFAQFKPTIDVYKPLYKSIVVSTGLSSFTY